MASPLYINNCDLRHIFAGLAQMYTYGHISRYQIGVKSHNNFIDNLTSGETWKQKNTAI